MDSIEFAEIASRISQEEANPNFSFLDSNSEAQTAFLMSLLSDNKANDFAEINRQVSHSPTTSNSVKSDIHDFGNQNIYKNEASPTKSSGKKPASEDEESDPSQNKRKAQNRAAQRAFRERKENRVRFLEEKVKELENLNAEQITELFSENKMLKDVIIKLQSENTALLSSFNQPLTVNQTFEERPQKVARGYSPTSHFDTVNSPDSALSTSLTPEANNLNNFLNFDPPITPEAQESVTVTNANVFASDPKQFDLQPQPLQASYHNSEGFVKMWEKLHDHPRFHEFDMDVLCGMMKKRASCSDSENFDALGEFEKIVDELYSQK